MDMDQVNVFKNPEVAQTPWTFATLKPGDCIYVPAGEVYIFNFFFIIFHSLVSELAFNSGYFLLGFCFCNTHYQSKIAKIETQ